MLCRNAQLSVQLSLSRYCPVGLWSVKTAVFSRWYLPPGYLTELNDTLCCVVPLMSRLLFKVLYGNDRCSLVLLGQGVFLVPPMRGYQWDVEHGVSRRLGERLLKRRPALRAQPECWTDSFALPGRVFGDCLWELHECGSQPKKPRVVSDSLVAGRGSQEVSHYGSWCGRQEGRP